MTAVSSVRQRGQLIESMSADRQARRRKILR
jgi:hypothetical protein